MDNGHDQVLSQTRDQPLHLRFIFHPFFSFADAPAETYTPPQALH